MKTKHENSKKFVTGKSLKFFLGIFSAKHGKLWAFMDYFNATASSSSSASTFSCLTVSESKNSR